MPLETRITRYFSALSVCLATNREFDEETSIDSGLKPRWCQRQSQSVFATSELFGQWCGKQHKRFI
jgi:hypothetical protein